MQGAKIPGANTHKKLVCPKKPTAPNQEVTAVGVEEPLPLQFYDWQLTQHPTNFTHKESADTQISTYNGPIDVERITLSFNNESDSTESRNESEIVYPMVHTEINGVKINIMIDSGAASSHIISECAEAINSVQVKRHTP